MYDELPIYQRVASAFKCSWEQIKNIVANRNQILKYYASCQIIDINKDDPKVVRHKKINFLGNCMYEYIKRAHYYQQQAINDEVIRMRAMEFKDIINIEKFFPNRAWIRDFKSVFNIDLEHMSQIIVSKKPQKSLNCKDIITYCAKEVDTALASQPGSTETKLVGDESSLESSENYDYPQQFNFEYEGRPDFEEDLINEDEEGPTIDFGNYRDDHEEEDLEKKPSLNEKEEEDVKPDVSILEDLLKNQNSNSRLAAINIKEEPLDDAMSRDTSMRSPSESSTIQENKDIERNALKRRSASPIATYDEALAFIGPLEDFAICEEDFKAINLLTQLAEVYEKAKKRKLKGSGGRKHNNC